jgi:hypothetical protein
MDIKRLFSPKPAAIIILVVSFGVYFNALPNGFVYDDQNYVVSNPWIRDIAHLPDAFTSSERGFIGVSNYYRPFMHIIYLLDYHIFGLNPLGFHLTNLLFHSGISVLVLFITCFILNNLRVLQPPDPQTKKSVLSATHDLMSTNNLTVAFFAALFFATHPIHTESVAWVSGATDLSFTLFYLLSFYFYLKADGVWGKFFIVSLLFFFMAVLCKEPALTLPLLLFAYDYSSKRGPTLSFSSNTLYLLLKRYLPYLVAAGIYLILRTYAVGEFSPRKAHAGLSGYEYFINVFPLFAQYLGKLILPINLNAAYVFHPIHSLLEWRGILSVAVTLCFIVTLYLARDRNRIAFFSLLLAVIPLLPVFYIPALGEHTFAERYLYLPSVGFVILVSLGIFGSADLMY